MPAAGAAAAATFDDDDDDDATEATKDVLSQCSSSTRLPV